MRSITSFAMALALFVAGTGIELSATAVLPKHPGSQWEILKHGNKEFVKNHTFAKQRKKLVSGQNPHTTVHCCIDSRAAPELVFSRGLGEIFVTRSGGNVTDAVINDSIEFTIVNPAYDVKTLVVMGHSHCGAVEGALARLRKNGGHVDTGGPGHLNAVLIPIEMAIVSAGIDIYGKDALEKSIHANVLYVINQIIQDSPGIAQALEKGQIDIIGSIYDLRSGKVRKIAKFTKHHIPRMLKIT